MLFILLIPAALTSPSGSMVGSRRQGWALYAAMAMLVVVGSVVAYAAEQNGSPAQQEAGLELAAERRHHRRQHGGQGAAQRDRRQHQVGGGHDRASNGSVNSSHDSYTGIGGAVPLANMMTGEVIFGGVGSGLYGMLLFVLLTVFIAGLMVGRTPEYLGKKIEAREVKLVLIGVLVDAGPRPRAHGARGRDQLRRPVDLQPRARRASPRRSTPTSRRATTTAPPSPATPATCSPTRPATSAPTGSASPTSSAGWRCSRPLRAAARRARGRRFAGR